MIQSMTGYARSERKDKGRVFVLELRSVNHKYCDISIKLPKTLLGLEGMIKKTIQEKFSRGKFDVLVSRNGSDDYTRRLVLDEELVSQYFNILQGLKKKFGLKGDIDINLLAGFSDLIKVAEVEEDQKAIEKVLMSLLQRTIDSLIKVRREEGKELHDDIVKRVRIVASAINRVDEIANKALSAYHKRLEERVRSLNRSLKIDTARLAQEVALIAERCDITEEIVRFKSHIKQFNKLLKEDKGVGRRLDFLLQEMNREINTVGSKANDA
ncbi:MAG: YicC/YloC family endoribonuclease, partial [Nitrospirota bacterium]